MSISNNSTTISASSSNHPNSQAVNPESFDWSKIGGINIDFQTHSIKMDSPSRMIMTVSTSLRMVCFILVVISTLLIGFAVWLILQGESIIITVGLLFGSVMFLMMSYWLWVSNKSGVFDKDLGWFWFGSTRISEMDKVESLSQKCRLSDVVGVQLIESKILSENNYNSYELNLLLKNGERFHIVKHSGENLKQEAKKLAQFLGIKSYQGRFERVYLSKPKLVITED